MNQVDGRQLLPIRATSNSRKSLYAEDSEDSDEDYQPNTIFMPLAWDKKQNSQSGQFIANLRALAMVETVKKCETVQQNIIPPNHLFDSVDDFKAEEPKEIIVKPLNFAYDTEPKHSANGIRNSENPQLMQPMNQPWGLKFRYDGDERQQTGYVQTRQQKQQSGPVPANNRVLMSSHGARWGIRFNQTNPPLVKTSQPLPPSTFSSHHPQSVTNLTSQLLDRQHSKLVHHYDNLQRTFNNWLRMMLDLPFRLAISLSATDVLKTLTDKLAESVNFRWQPQEVTSPDWDQQRLKTYFLEYKLCNKFITLESLSKQNIGLKKYKNCVYFGGINAGRKEGEGILVYYTGRRFEGIFTNDLKSRGVEIDEDEIYCGQFTNGIREGMGMLKNQTSVAFGRFKDGQWSTDGVCVRNGHVYVSFETSTLKLIKHPTGQLFLGETIAFEKHGMGIEKFVNGDVYIGNYDHGKPQSYGQYYWSNGAIYFGEFLMGLRHGRGRWYILHGDSYDGEYMNDKKCGEGEYRWRNGTYYKGSFENDYRHGYGEMYWADGRVYKGQWTNGIENMKRVQFQGQPKKAPTIPAKIGLYKTRTTSSSVKKARLPLLRNSQNQRRTPSHPPRFLNKTIDVRTSAEQSHSNSTSLNSTHHSIPRERLKALFNPNFNFEY